MEDNDPEVPSGRPNGHDRALAAELAKRIRDLARFDAIRQAVTSSATELLRSLDPDRSIPKVLELIGLATEVSRIYVLENATSPGGRNVLSQRYEWDAPVATPANQSQGFSRAASIIGGEPLSALAKGDPQIIVTHEAEEPSRGVLEALGILSVVIIPIFVGAHWWGYLAADARPNVLVCRRNSH
jgi:GAF domain-containing protein